MRHLLPILAFALLAAPAMAQQLDQRPATSAQPPPTRMPDDAATAPAAPTQPPAITGTPPAQPPRTEPPPGHVTLPAPTVPGQRLPEGSEGAGQLGQSPVPARPALRPDASTTDAPRTQPPAR